MPSTYVKTLIPNFEDVFGKHSDMFILAEALSAPVIEIHSNQTKTNFEARLRLLNPLNEEFDAVQINMRLEADLEFELLEDFTLLANITDINLEVTQLQAYFKTPINKESVNRKLSALKPTAISMANHVLGQGKGLPVPKQVEQDLSMTRLFTYDHFLMIESDPRIETTLRQKVNQITEVLQTELLKFLQS